MKYKYKRKYIIKICEYCKKKYSGREDLKLQRFCSIKCKSKAIKRKKTYLICKQCNKKFYGGSLKRKFCSKQCYYNSKKGIYPKCLKNSISHEQRVIMGINSTIKQGKSKKPTKPEQQLYNALDEMCISYEKQKPLENITICDAFIKTLNTVIYVDGEYWHSLPNVKARDKRITKELLAKGYKVIRYTV